ncbi:MAG TPA: hypothetical protein VIN72_12810 [Lutibacter sp.]
MKTTIKQAFLSSIYILIGLLFLNVSCEKSNLNMDAPSCIENEIKKIKIEDVRNPPAQVWKWEVDGQIYYYINSDCCDQYNLLYDNNCDIICAPDGGITGLGDGNCPDFKEPIKKTLIWQDNRR